MRFLRNLRLLITDDDAGEGLKLFDEADQLGRTEIVDTFIDAVSSGRLTVDNVDGLVAVPFGDIGTAKALLLAPDGALNFRVNGGSVDLPLGAPSSGRGMLYWEGDITEIRVENPDATNIVSVLYAIVGVE